MESLMLVFAVAVLSHLGMQSYVLNRNVQQIERRLWEGNNSVFDNEIGVFYVKTHKTASTTTQNIFFRIAENYNMKKAMLLFNGGVWIDWPYPKFEPSIVTNLEAKRKVFAQHVRFVADKVEPHFPKSRSFYVTTIRNPVTQILSTLHFFNPESSKSQTISWLLNKEERKQKIRGTSQDCLFSNPNIYDLGYIECGKKYNGTVQQLIDTVVSDFDLVLLPDFYLEGLVLMKRRLGLSYIDLVHLKAKQALEDRSEKIKLATTLVNELSQEDLALYNAYKQYYEVIAPSLKQEVEILKEIISYFEKICSSATIDRRTNWFARVEYILNQNAPDHFKLLCQKMMMDDVDYYQYLASKNEIGQL